jgi:hypothetical protein
MDSGQCHDIASKSSLGRISQECKGKEIMFSTKKPYKSMFPNALFGFSTKSCLSSASSWGFLPKFAFPVKSMLHERIHMVIPQQNSINGDASSKSLHLDGNGHIGSLKIVMVKNLLCTDMG